MNPRLLKLENQFFDLYCRFHPTTASSLGLSRYNGDLTDFSENRIRSYLREIHRIRWTLKDLGEAGSSEDALDAWLLERKIRLEEKELVDFCFHRRDPSAYVSDVLYGLWFLLVRPFSKEEKLKGILSRLEKLPDLFHQARDMLEDVPRVWLDIARDETEGLLLFLKDCRKELLRDFSKAQREIRKVFEKSLGETESFQSYLAGDLKKRANAGFAAGPHNFGFLLKNYHGFSESSDKILQRGWKVFEETQEAMKALASELRKGTRWEDLVDEIKKDHPARGDLLKAYRREVVRTKDFIRKNRLVSIPRGEILRVIETPPFARSTIPYAAYVDPPLFTKDRTGHFFVTPVSGSGKNIQKLLEENSYPSMRVTALHEGYPGHHLQFVYQANLRQPLRKIFNCSSYFEGWALYCEEMMGESGFYDSRTRLLQLKDKLWRACRVIVDVGMHTGRMTDDEAVSFLAKNARMAKASARADVNWYTQRPTVPLSYLTGMLKIKDLREEARKKWGSRFTLKRFHEWFLSFGAIPIPLIREALQASSANSS
jgi:uncharacterized protein (DUF885 family)